MSDWEISASTQAQLKTVVQSVVAARNINIPAINGPDGFMIEGVLNNGTRISIYYYKTKRAPTGNTLQGAGWTYPEMAAVAGVFAIMRWISPTNANPPTPPAGSGVTLTALPANPYARFAS